MSEKYLDLWKTEIMRSARSSLYLIYFFVLSSVLLFSSTPLISFSFFQRKSWETFHSLAPPVCQYVQIKGKYP